MCKSNHRRERLCISCCPPWRLQKITGQYSFYCKTMSTNMLCYQQQALWWRLWRLYCNWCELAHVCLYHVSCISVLCCCVPSECSLRLELSLGISTLWSSQSVCFSTGNASPGPEPPWACSPTEGAPALGSTSSTGPETLEHTRQSSESSYDHSRLGAVWLITNLVQCGWGGGGREGGGGEVE